MNENIDQIKAYLEQVVNQEFLPQIFAKINSHKQYLSELNEMIDGYNKLSDNLNSENEFESIDGAIKLNQNILEKLDYKFHFGDVDSLLNELENFNNSLNNFISESEEVRKEVQDKTRFYFQPGDKFFLRGKKLFKNVLYKISITPLKIQNIVLKLFKKPIKEINYWNHTIPVRNLRSIYLKNSLFLDLAELYKTTLSTQTIILLAAKNYYEQVEEIFRLKHNNLNVKDFNSNDFEVIRSQYSEAIKLLDNIKVELNNKSSKIIQSTISNYSDAYLKAGTIELSKAKLSNSKVVSSEKEFVNLYNKLEKGWSNTQFALIEDWRMDNELYTTRYCMLLEFIKTTDIVSKKLNNNVKPLITLIEQVIAEHKDRFNLLKQSSSEMEVSLRESRESLQSSLTEKLVPQTIDTLLKQEILDNIDELEVNVEKNISKLSDKRALVKTDIYDKEIRDAEISNISLIDMVSFSSLPKFKSSILKTKADQSLKLQKIQNFLLEIDQISDFSIDSAQIMLQQKKGDVDEVKKIVVEGLDRALKKIGDIDNQILNLNESFSQKTKEPIDKLNEDLIKLTFTDSIFELRIKIAKDRALQKSREYRKATINKIKTALPKLISLAKEGYTRSTQLYSKTRKFIGLEKSVTTVKGEVSNFLSETAEAINKLPFVYQRLFVVEPIADERFFFGRDAELQKLSQAYSKWSNGKFSPTIIFGEKGSGATSLINMFIKKNDLKDELIRISLDETCASKNDFLNLFSDYRKVNAAGELQDLISYLNAKSPVKKIIVLENLQHLYLRKINGFENLKFLFELMSETNENVFWITTCTVYGYRYLQKTISISDYFTNHIELGDLNDKQIIDIILKRHRVSGYDLYFEAEESILSNKKFQKLSDDEKQIQLEKDYFSNLNKFANSNISLALLFWVRSTSSISEDKITIGHLPKIDFSFLSALSNTKLFILNLLLLHDGLTEEDASNINGTSIEYNRRLLMTMEDDGILVKKNKLYLINPLLYRPIVEVLKSKNIIH